MRAGKLDRRVQLQQKSAATAPDPTSGTWTTTRSVWAERMSPAGSEPFVGTQYVANASAVYRMYYRSDVTPLWRLVDGTEVWQIEAVNPGERKGVEMFLVCSRINPDDVTA